MNARMKRRGEALIGDPIIRIIEPFGCRAPGSKGLRPLGTTAKPDATAADVLESRYERTAARRHHRGALRPRSRARPAARPPRPARGDHGPARGRAEGDRSC